MWWDQTLTVVKTTVKTIKDPSNLFIKFRQFLGEWIEHKHILCIVIFEANKFIPNTWPEAPTRHREIVNIEHLSPITIVNIIDLVNIPCSQPKLTLIRLSCWQKSTKRPHPLGEYEVVALVGWGPDRSFHLSNLLAAQIEWQDATKTAYRRDCFIVRQKRPKQGSVDLQPFQRAPNLPATPRWLVAASRNRCFSQIVGKLGLAHRLLRLFPRTIFVESHIYGRFVTYKNPRYRVLDSWIRKVSKLSCRRVPKHQRICVVEGCSKADQTIATYPVIVKLSPPVDFFRACFMYDMSKVSTGSA